jgi:hypothetical protein
VTVSAKVALVPADLTPGLRTAVCPLSKLITVTERRRTLWMLLTACGKTVGFRVITEVAG